MHGAKMHVNEIACETCGGDAVQKRSVGGIGASPPDFAPHNVGLRRCAI